MDFKQKMEFAKANARAAALRHGGRPVYPDTLEEVFAYAAYFLRTRKGWVAQATKNQGECFRVGLKGGSPEKGNISCYDSTRGYNVTPSAQVDLSQVILTKEDFENGKILMDEYLAVKDAEPASVAVQAESVLAE